MKYKRVSREWEWFYEQIGIKPQFGSSIDNGFIQTSDIVAKYPEPTEELLSLLRKTVEDYTNARV